MTLPAKKLLSLLFILLLALPGAASAASVSGKLTAAGAPAAGVRLLAWPISTQTLTGEAPFGSERTGEDGAFRLELPAGDYYLLADGEELFAFYGRNPVNIPAEGLADVSIGMLPKRLPPPEKNGGETTGIVGRVTVDGRPLPGAVVYLYSDLSTRLKGMGLSMVQTDDQGYFETPIWPGTYYLVVRHRRSSDLSGPLRAGDAFGYYPANPLRIAEGKVERITIPALEVPEKVDLLSDSLFGGTRIQGRIVDRENRPVAGVRALLYDERTMLNRPLYVSQPTGADGRFALSLPRGGTYYLAARDTLGGAPAPGELYGIYDKTADHSLQVKTGSLLEGVEITVEPMW